MIYLLTVLAFGVYYFRRVWLTPWARYVNHVESKAAGVFMTVKQVHWYPPFLDFERTFHLLPGGTWVDEKTGWSPPSSRDNKSQSIYGNDPQSRLRCMLAAARNRDNLRAQAEANP